MKKIVICLLCLGLLLTGCGGRTEETGFVSLWLAEGDPLAGPLAELAEEYNRTKDRDALPLRLRVLESEEQMSAGLAAGPDLLLCSHELAFSLWEQGSLRPAEAGDFVCPDWLRDRSEAVGAAVFPLGARLPLRSGDPEAGAFSAEDWAPLLYQRMLEAGCEFLARPERDLNRAEYRAAYNTLAEAAFDGRLILSEEPEALLRGGALTGAYLWSDTLRALPETETAPLGEGELLAEGECLAVLAREGRQSRSAAAFLRWLLAGERAGRLALDAGLVPLCGALPEGKTPLERCLLEIAGQRRLHLPEEASSYEQNRADYEAFFRTAMAALR